MKPSRLTKPRDVECVALRVVLIERGISRRDLAGETGLALGTIYNIVSGTSRYARSRRLVNAALGLPIFTLPDEVDGPDSTTKLKT